MTTEIAVKKVSIEINESLHSSMKDLAKRKRLFLGLIYEAAITLYLSQPENYTGKEEKNIEYKEQKNIEYKEQKNIEYGAFGKKGNYTGKEEKH